MALDSQEMEEGLALDILWSLRIEDNTISTAVSCISESRRCLWIVEAKVPAYEPTS